MMKKMNSILFMIKDFIKAFRFKRRIRLRPTFPKSDLEAMQKPLRKTGERLSGNSKLTKKMIYNEIELRAVELAKKLGWTFRKKGYGQYTCLKDGFFLYIRDMAELEVFINDTLKIV